MNKSRNSDATLRTDLGRPRSCENDLPPIAIMASETIDETASSMRPNVRNAKERDQLSEGFANWVTPSPEASASQLTEDERDNAPSLIEVDSDERISAEEFSIIKEECSASWLIEAIAYVRAIPTTKPLNRLVRLWFRIQEMSNFPAEGRSHEHKLSADYRPLFIDGWMKCHRVLERKKVPLTAHDIETTFFHEFTEWWSTLQPVWRTMIFAKPFTKDVPSQSDWSKLCRTGPNGIALIVLSLTWISFHILPDHNLFPDYLMYVEDATWAFDQIIIWIKKGRPTIMSAKRRANSEGIQTPAKSQRVL